MTAENIKPKLNTPQTPVLSVSCRMLRSPSHESVTTDLSLFSVSSIASDALARGMRLVSFKSYNDTLVGRGPSPNPERQRYVHLIYNNYNSREHSKFDFC